MKLKSFLLAGIAALLVAGPAAADTKSRGHGPIVSPRTIP